MAKSTAVVKKALAGAAAASDARHDMRWASQLLDAARGLAGDHPMMARLRGGKSNDEGEKGGEVKSAAVRRAFAREPAARRGWTLDDGSVFVDAGISGAESRTRPGPQPLLAGVRVPVPPFQR